MPRSAGGTFSVPAGTEAVTGTTIDSSDYNGLLTDLETEVTDSLSRSGKGGMLADLDMGAFDITFNATGKLDWGSGNVTITHSTNALAFAGGSNGYSFDGSITLSAGSLNGASHLALAEQSSAPSAGAGNGYYYVADTAPSSPRFVDDADQNAAICRIATGTYTGDGSTSQAITGVGFQPKYVRIWERQILGDDEYIVWETTDTIVDDNASGMAFLMSDENFDGATAGSVSNAIIALGTDGFTVDDNGDDSGPNENTKVYNYLCLG